MVYNESDYIQLSGIQHFSFCRRQWALIHIEQKWEDNVRTVQGNIFHERPHDSAQRERRGNIIIARNLRIASSELGVCGNCDVVEFHQNPNGTKLSSEDGFWMPFPIEYKHGISKENDADRLQLCVQAMCLEEMMGCHITTGALFYENTRRRETVELDEKLRQTAKSMLTEMHEYILRGYTPKVKIGKRCNACSLKETCVPALCKNISVGAYINSRIMEDEI